MFVSISCVNFLHAQDSHSTLASPSPGAARIKIENAIAKIQASLQEFDLIESLGLEDGNAGWLLFDEVVSVLQGQQRERLGGAGGGRGGADEGDERRLGLERGAAEKLEEAREEGLEVGGEVRAWGGRLDGRGRRELRHLPRRQRRGPRGRGAVAGRRRRRRRGRAAAGRRRARGARSRSAPCSTACSRRRSPSSPAARCASRTIAGSSTRSRPTSSPSRATRRSRSSTATTRSTKPTSAARLGEEARGGRPRGLAARR